MEQLVKIDDSVSEFKGNKSEYLKNAIVGAYQTCMDAALECGAEQVRPLQQAYLCIIVCAVLRYAKLDEDDVLHLFDYLKKEFGERLLFGSLGMGLATVDQSIGVCEADHHSLEAIIQIMVFSTTQVTDRDFAMKCAVKQLKAVEKLIEDIKSCGLENWVSEDGEGKGEKEQGRFDAVMTMSVVVAREERSPKEIFRLSSQMCIFLNELNEQIDKLSRRLSKQYNETEYYQSWYEAKLVRAGERAKPAVIIWFILFFVTYYYGDLIFVLMTSAVIGGFFLVRAWDKQCAKDYADEKLASYHAEHMELVKHEKEWRDSLDLYEREAAKTTRYLKLFEHHGGIPEYLWSVGGELWNLVELKRADTLKEAINLYDSIQTAIKMGIILQAQYDELRYINDQLDIMRRNQEEMIRNQTEIEFNQNLEMVLNLMILSRL